MRLANERAITTLGAFALGAGFVLLLRLSQRAWKRKVARDNAVSKLRESGEFFLTPVDTEATSVRADSLTN
jgi:hypothetical protein